MKKIVISLLLLTLSFRLSAQIDYLEQESGQADALEEQRRRLAAALTSAAAAGESGGVAGPSGAEKMARSDLDGGPGKTAESEPLPAEEGQTAEETLPLLEETARLDRVLDSAQGERADLLAAKARGESWQAGRAGGLTWGQPGVGNGRNAPAFWDGTIPETGRTGAFARGQDPAAEREQARNLDRIFQRDSRRYDGGFFLY